MSSRRCSEEVPRRRLLTDEMAANQVRCAGGESVAVFAASEGCWRSMLRQKRSYTYLPNRHDSPDLAASLSFGIGH